MVKPNNKKIQYIYEDLHKGKNAKYRGDLTKQYKSWLEELTEEDISKLKEDYKAIFEEDSESSEEIEDPKNPQKAEESKETKEETHIVSKTRGVLKDFDLTPSLVKKNHPHLLNKTKKEIEEIYDNKGKNTRLSKPLIRKIVETMKKKTKDLVKDYYRDHEYDKIFNSIEEWKEFIFNKSNLPKIKEKVKETKEKIESAKSEENYKQAFLLKEKLETLEAKRIALNSSEDVLEIARENKDHRAKSLNTNELIRAILVDWLGRVSGFTLQDYKELVLPNVHISNNMRNKVIDAYRSLPKP